MRKLLKTLNKFTMKFINNYIVQFSKLLLNFDLKEIENIIHSLIKIKKNKGRIFFLGVGGSSANASHAVNDFRKICNIECYAPTDNVSELTARINDEGFENSFLPYLKISNLSRKDAVFIFSVGGGNLKKKISVNLIKAIDYAKLKKSTVLGIVGKSDGYAKKNSKYCFVLPDVNKDFLTPFAETAQAVIWHLIVSHPLLKLNKTKW
jgi:D-sedoheptulose 7-phosphate isomerase